MKILILAVVIAVASAHNGEYCTLLIFHAHSCSLKEYIAYACPQTNSYIHIHFNRPTNSIHSEYVTVNSNYLLFIYFSSSSFVFL